MCRNALMARTYTYRQGGTLKQLIPIMRTGDILQIPAFLAVREIQQTIILGQTSSWFTYHGIFQGICLKVSISVLFLA
jgi:hypothetical protein